MGRRSTQKKIMTLIGCGVETDDICVKYSDLSSKLSIRLLKEDDGDPLTVVIEGPARALIMLSELLAAVATSDARDGFSLSPFGAGSFHFSPSSEMGIYLTRLPD